jgi:hypothetical protein
LFRKVRHFTVFILAGQDFCQIAAKPGFYPERLVTMDYVAKYAPVMEDRLVEAGTRLAQVLNKSLG